MKRNNKTNRAGKNSKGKTRKIRGGSWYDPRTWFTTKDATGTAIVPSTEQAATEQTPEQPITAQPITAQPITAQSITGQATGGKKRRRHHRNK